MKNEKILGIILLIISSILFIFSGTINVLFIIPAIILLFLGSLFMLVIIDIFNQEK